MMTFIRTLIYKLFGLKTYLRLVSKAYLFLIRFGFFEKKHAELFYLKKIIKPGFYCIDIGANLGYYSVNLSKLCGEKGKVYAIEPVPVFAEVWKRNIKNLELNNITLWNYALGAENRNVKMGMPEVNGVIHHGMTKISSENDNYAEQFEVEMRIPDELFDNLEKLDFVKCDVEGYESIVFGNMINTIRKYKPIVQSELGGLENRKTVIEIFKNLNYDVTTLDNNKLVEASTEIIEKSNKDFYFIPKK